ncbi:MAG: FlgD immunoglobulin-like domain containing protein, partial [bacterium]
GEFAIGRPDGFPLLAGFPDRELSSHFSVKVGLRVASNKPGIAEPLTLVDSATVLESRYIAISWQWQNIKIWEKLRLLDEDSLRKFIYVELLLYNNSTDSQSIGTMFFLDPTLGGENPEHIFVLSEEIDSVRAYSGINVPFYWIGTNDTLFSPGFSTMYMGVFLGSEMPYPDRVIFGNDYDLSSVQWDYTISRARIEDLGVLIYWNPKRIAPAEFYFVGFYYGGGYPGMKIERELNRMKPVLEISEPCPNPFNSTCRIELSNKLDFPIPLKSEVFDINGRHIKTLSFEVLTPGKHQIIWDGTNNANEPVPSGVYLIIFSAGEFKTYRKVFLIK